jgi:hypothetical protein
VILARHAGEMVSCRARPPIRGVRCGPTRCSAVTTDVSLGDGPRPRTVHGHCWGVAGAALDPMVGKSSRTPRGMRGQPAARDLGEARRPLRLRIHTANGMRALAADRSPEARAGKRNPCPIHYSRRVIRVETRVEKL